MVFSLNFSTLSSIKKKKNILERVKGQHNEMDTTETETVLDTIAPLGHEQECTSGDAINELTSTWFFSFIQSIVNKMPNLPSDHINEIVDVDFPTELAVSTFYQLLSQMTLLGSAIFHKCIIVRLLSFTDWNRKYSFADNKTIWITSPDSEQLDRKEVEPDEALDELFKENGGIGVQKIYNDESSSYSSITSSYYSTLPASSTQQEKKSVILEIVVQLQYLSPQSELFSKILHYFSTTIFLRPIPYEKYVTRITIPIPSISTIEPIITWLYNHDDEAWMDTITSKNFEQVCRNAMFLGLSEDAFAVLEKVFQKVMADENRI